MTKPLDRQVFELVETEFNKSRKYVGHVKCPICKSKMLYKIEGDSWWAACWTVDCLYAKGRRNK